MKGAGKVLGDSQGHKSPGWVSDVVAKVVELNSNLALVCQWDIISISIVGHFFHDTAVPIKYEYGNSYPP